MDIKETTFGPKTYLVWRKVVEMKNIMDQNMWQTAYGSVHAYIQKHNLKIAGPGAALYFDWNEASGTTEIGIGNPVTGAGEVDDPDLALVPVAESRAIMATVEGTYGQFPEVHNALQQHLKERGVNLKDVLPIEEYIVTGMDKPRPEDWETNIYYVYI
jgi:effector-binding domain-containing protein